MNYLNSQLPSNCLSLSELHTIARDGTDEGAEHLASCERCQALLRLIEQQPAEDDPVFAPVNVDADFLAGLGSAEIPSRQAPDEWSFGEVLAVTSPTRDELLICALVAWGEAMTTLEVAPITTETLMATEWDLLLDASASPLGYQAAAQVWNRVPIDRGQISERLGLLGDESKAELQLLYEAAETGGDRPQVRTGVAVESKDDPRFSFQALEAERVRAYWAGTDDEADAIELEETTAVAGAAAAEIGQAPGDRVLDPAAGSGAAFALTIGEWFGRWLDETGYGPEDLARDASWQLSDVKLLLADRVSDQPQLLLNADYFARLLAATKIDEYKAEEVLFERVPAALFAATAPTEQTSVVFRRGAPRGWSRRRKAGLPATAPSASGPPTKEQEQARKVWVMEVLDALAEHRGG